MPVRFSRPGDLVLSIAAGASGAQRSPPLAGSGGYTAIVGVPYAAWYSSGGKTDKEPPAIVKQARDLLTIVGHDLSGRIRIAQTNIGNIPGRTLNSNALLSPTGVMPQTFCFNNARH